MRIGGLHGVALLGADAEHGRNEKRLVVVASERCGLIVLDERTLAAALAAGANLQSFRCLHHERLVIAPRAESGKDGLCHIERSRVSGILRVVLEYQRRMVAFRTERVRHILSQVHPLPALVVQAESACLSKALASISGSSLPRAEALRRIPRHAF